MKDVNYKVCSSDDCKVMPKGQPLKNFHKMAHARDGLRPSCKTCVRTAINAARRAKRAITIPAEASPPPLSSGLPYCELYRPILDQQGLGCRVCKTHVEDAWNLRVYLDPSTSEPKALVCIACSEQLLFIGADSKRTIQVLKYLNGLG